MTELRTPPARRQAPPDPDAEQEVDVGRYARLLLERWWLPLAGLIVGAAIGYVLSLGGSQVYQAKAVIYLGQPQSPTSSAPVTSIQTNPATVNTIVHSESALQQAAAAAHMKVGALRNSVASAAVSGSSASKAAVNPLVAITVKGGQPRKVAAAANALAQVVNSKVSSYADQKIANLKVLLNGENSGLTTTNARINELQDAIQKQGGLSSVERLLLVNQLGFAEQQLQQLQQQQSNTRLQLTLAQQVEKARIVTRAAAVKSTAKSHRNSALVGALIGLLLGIAAALLWDPVAERMNRPARV
jgi:capsular polysaccharide biosynthesis protein